LRLQVTDAGIRTNKKAPRKQNDPENSDTKCRDERSRGGNIEGLVEDRLCWDVDRLLLSHPASTLRGVSAFQIAPLTLTVNHEQPKEKNCETSENALASLVETARKWRTAGDLATTAEMTRKRRLFVELTLGRERVPG